MRLHTSQALPLAAAAGAGFVAVKMGLESKVPAIGPITPPIGLIIIGAALVLIRPLDGDAGEVLTGAGYGLVVAGVLQLGG